MSSHECSKCKSENVDAGTTQALNLSYATNKKGKLSIPIFAPFKTQVCLDCGFMELYMNTDKLRKKLNK